MKDLTNLRKIAEAATPGPWEAKQTPIHTPSGEGGDYYVSCPTGIDVASTVGSSYEQEEPDALHIATFDPLTVMELLDRVEKAEQAVQRVREACATEGYELSSEFGEFWVIAADDVNDALDGEQS